MTSTTKINKTAPFLSIDAFGEPNAFEEHYKKWLQYEVVNGDYAKSWQQTYDVDLLSILKRRKGIQFHESPEMAKDESSEDFRARRLKDAEQVAAALFDLEKPTIRSDAKSTIIAKCAFKATRKTTLISQVLKHEMKFVNAAKQVGTISETELCEAFIACFLQEMQDELNIVGAEDRPAKKTGFLGPCRRKGILKVPDVRERLAVGLLGGGGRGLLLAHTTGDRVAQVVPDLGLVGGRGAQHGRHQGL